MPSIGIIPSRNEGAIKQLTFGVKFKASKWSKDGKSIFALRNYGAYDQLYSLNVSTGDLKQMTDAPMSIHAFEISPDGSKLIWVGIDAHGSNILRLASKDGSNVKDLFIDKACDNGITMVSSKFEWDTIDYPSKNAWPSFYHIIMSRENVIP